MTTTTTTTTSTTRPQPIVYHIPATKLIPNSPHPLLYYPGFFRSSSEEQNIDATLVFDHFKSHGWNTQWIAKYGLSQPSHYHPETHECMAVLSGPGRIRFGVADLDKDWRKNTPLSAAVAAESTGKGATEDDDNTKYGEDGGGSDVDVNEGMRRGSTTFNFTSAEDQGAGVFFEKGGIELAVQAGDAFIIPAGVTHKSYNPRQGEAEDAVSLTGGDFHGIGGVAGKGDVEGARKVVKDVELSGFTMIGAYPGNKDWSWAEGGGHEGRYEQVWSVEKPDTDPLMGREGGLMEIWK